MANFPSLKMTAAGRELQAKAQTGQVLKFTRVALGDGDTPADPDALVALVSERQSLSIQRQNVPGDGTAVLRVIMTNQGLAAGFYMRELATFAEDPDTGVEVLYSYSNAGAESDFLPAEGAAVVWEGIFDLVTIVGNAENVTAVINDFITIALKSEVDALIPRLMPEDGTVGQMVRKASNAPGDVEYFSPELDGFDIRLTSVEEPRVAVANQRVFTLQKTVTNGLAVYISGERLSREAWTALSATQLQLDDPLAVGTRVLFVNNEEAGPGRALNVSLTGSTLVYPASSNTFTITDFDSFSVYAATTTVGTVTRNGAALTLDVPADAPEGTLDLEVTRDNVRATYRIAVGAAAIAAPEILAPVAGATDVTFEPDLAASAFVVYPAGYDSHAETHWQVARDLAFTDLVFDQQGAANLTAVSLAAAGVRLDPATRYYARAKYHGATLVSEWSAAVAFNTATIYIRKPTITSPLDGAVGVSSGLTVVADAFSVSGGADTHQSSRWQVSTVADFSSVMIDSGWSTAQLTTFKPPSLAQVTEYFARVKYRGSNVGDSEWSRAVMFVTADKLSGIYTPLNAGATGRSGASLTAIGEHLYLFGGAYTANGAAVYSNELWRFDPGANSWQQLANGGPGRQSHAAAAINGKLYVIGGWDGGYVVPSGQVYDPATNTWSSIASFGYAGANYMASAVIGGKWYVFGGTTNGNVWPTLHVYDPATNAWTRLADAPAGSTSGVAAAINGKFYAVGPNGNWSYDPATNTWASIAPLSPARHYAVSAVIAGKLYVFGGMTGYTSRNDLWSYDPALNAWESLPSGATPRHYHAGAGLNNTFYVFGPNTEFWSIQ